MSEPVREDCLSFFYKKNTKSVRQRNYESKKKNKLKDTYYKGFVKLSCI